MKNIIIKSVLFLSVTAGLFSSCVNDDEYKTPSNTLVTYELTTTTTVEAVQDAATNSPVAFTPSATDQIIEAYVTSNDEKGNFYKSISFQTKPTDGSDPIGFSVPINETTLFGEGFIPGRKVYIKLNGLYSAIVYGSLQIGSFYQPSTVNPPEIGRLSEFEWKNHLFPSATIVDESELVRTFSLADAYTDAVQNTLIELENVQFSDASINRTYYDIDSGGGATNHELISSVGGAAQIIRFSSFCPFTGNQVPVKSGKIRGVLTKYDTDFQFIVRYESDIQLTEDRFDVSPPIVGSNVLFNSTLNEPFTTYTSNQTNFPKYINDAVVGSRYWQLKTFSSNSYIEMSSFNGSGNPGVEAKTYFFVPVDFALANSITFKEKIRFNAGECIRVYYVSSTDYTAGGTFNIANFIDITSQFNITYPASGSSESSFNSAGTFSIPTTLLGTGYFVFEYIGTATITTTAQIDDIVIN